MAEICGRTQKDIFKEATYVHQIVKTFNVSWQAAENRLNNLGIIKDKVLVRFYSINKIIYKIK